MTKATVYPYKVYDLTADDFVGSTRMATRSRIKHIRGEIIPGTKTEIDEKHLEDGWTGKSFAENLAENQTSERGGGPRPCRYC